LQESKSVVHKQKDLLINIYLDPYNKRVRVEDSQGNLSKIISESEKIAKIHNAEKLIFKARKEQMQMLLERGFRFEGIIDRYFLGSDCFLFSKFYRSERYANHHWVKEDEILHHVLLLERQSEIIKPPIVYQFHKLGEADVSELANLYRSVFEVYPTPLNNPDFIRKTMEDGTIYVGFKVKNKIVSAASAEVNSLFQNAELTDCATLKEHRKYGLMKVLLKKLEEELITRGIYCAYSLARSLSFGMNAALFQLGYCYRGRMTNNCYIYNKLEDMNIWVRDLSSSSTSFGNLPKVEITE